MVRRMALGAGRNILAKYLDHWEVKICAGSLGLGTRLQVNEGGDLRISPGAIVDGLGEFCDQRLSEVFAGRKAGAETLVQYQVAGVVLIAPERSLVRECPLMKTNLIVRRQETIPPSRCTGVGIPHLEDSVKIGSLPGIAEGAGVRTRSAECRVPEASILEATAKMKMYPHMRRSADLNAVDTRVYESFVCEAEAVNGLAGNQTELLAIFRCVPVAMISRFRFLEESRMLFYTISSSNCPSCTRVHDLAAVRDNSSRTVRLVAHRTRYRTALLS